MNQSLKAWLRRKQRPHLYGVTRKRESPRRTFLKVGLGGGLLVAVGSKWLPYSQAMEQVESEYVLIIDLNKCTGCGACEQACNQRNNLPEGKSFIHRLQQGR